MGEVGEDIGGPMTAVGALAGATLGNTAGTVPGALAGATAGAAPGLAVTGVSGFVGASGQLIQDVSKGNVVTGVGRFAFGAFGGRGIRALGNGAGRIGTFLNSDILSTIDKLSDMALDKASKALLGDVLDPDGGC